MLDLVGAQRLLRRPRQLRRMPARQAGSPSVPRHRRVRRRGGKLRLRWGLLQRRALRARRSRARLPGRVQPVGRSLHRRRGLLQRATLLRGGGLDERLVRRGSPSSLGLRRWRAARTGLQLLWSGLRADQRLLQRRHLQCRHRGGLRRGSGLRLRQSASVVPPREDGRRSLLHSSSRSACRTATGSAG
jgi:hypothetical protein